MVAVRVILPSGGQAILLETGNPHCASTCVLRSFCQAGFPMTETF